MKATTDQPVEARRPTDGFCWWRFTESRSPRVCSRSTAQHLTTHTDVDSEARIQAEIESCGFSLDTELRTDIIHDDVLVHDHIFNFTKAR